MKKIASLFFILLIVSACYSEKKPVANYIKAMDDLKTGNYNTAAETFERIEDEQPFTKEATNGLIMSSYSYYKAGKYEDSIRIINYFIQSNPINENLSYMYYLKGLNYYDRIRSMNKAKDITESADTTFKELLYKYPNSEYKEDVLSRLKKTETYLSGNEMNIGNYYLKRKNYLGAINHFKTVIQVYPKSNFVPEALYRLVEINAFLNLKLESVQYYKILMENYSNSSWTKNATKIIKRYVEV